MRAYLPDEPDHMALRSRLLEGDEPVVSSVVARLEFASAAHAAGGDHRLTDPSGLLARFDADCSPGGRLALISLRPDTILMAAYSLVSHHAVRTLDAIHLAVALEDGLALADPDPLVFVTRDEQQAETARALGLTTS